ncbi:hypothetical protein SAMN05444487_10767 [Marininema mesophilum]|uniref:Uncharacterized protein n=1 Tax=Marininema mesophilum TaxID=1048340 RepID=A0A1H2X3A9_9BACL|nr:hypothetical protein SAMN05444487_10767 [Marininema mesophilum]
MFVISDIKCPRKKTGVFNGYLPFLEGIVKKVSCIKLIFREGLLCPLNSLLFITVPLDRTMS